MTSSTGSPSRGGWPPLAASHQAAIWAAVRVAAPWMGVAPAGVVARQGLALGSSTAPAPMARRGRPMTAPTRQIARPARAAAGGGGRLLPPLCPSRPRDFTFLCGILGPTAVNLLFDAANS